MSDKPAATTYAMRIFDLLEHWSPDLRRQVFYEIEQRWCWDCGLDYDDCTCPCTCCGELPCINTEPG